MNIKVIGALATVVSFGIGIAIPNIAGAGAIGSYEEALAIVENGAVEKTEENAEASDEDASKADAVAQADTSGSSVAKQESSEGADFQSDDTKENKQNANVNPDADVVLDFTFDDIEVNGVKFVGADYDSMLKAFGLDKIQVEYTDGGFKINSDPVEWNSKKAYYNGSYTDENGSYQSLYWDGEKYVTWDLEEKEPDRYSINISGSWEDKDNYSDYWNFGYYTEKQNDGKIIRDSLYVGNYEHGLSDEEIKEISGLLTAPFIGGDYEAMNKVMHTDEMLEKGLKDESGSGENYERYIVDTSLGKCSLNVSTSEGQNGKNTYYYYEFENGKYAISIGFNEGLTSATSINYNYKH